MALGFLVLLAVEACLLAGAWKRRRDRTDPFVGLCCAAAMAVMALVMSPMPAMTSGGFATHLTAGMPVWSTVLVLGLVTGGLVAAVAPVVTPGGGRAPRRWACTATHCVLCLGMGLPVLLAV